ncbi:MAG: hypothetical protein K5842_09030 [Bacteroidales bacterium]|nr:hypothetical protein [Bacteroidales bacterium]
MFDFIKRKYQQRHLRNLITEEREKRIDNWNDIKTIGLIFTVGDAEHWNLIHRFVTAQESHGKEVHLIGFQADKYEINYIFSHTRTIICHEKEDFNYFGIPKEGVVEGFTSEHFDLVIDTTVQPDFFGKYVTALSNANLKVGYSHTDSDKNEGSMEMYDMAIQSQEPLDLKNYIEQIVKYLMMVKKN